MSSSTIGSTAPRKMLIAGGLKKMAANFNRQVSQELVSVFIEGLQDLTETQITTAFTRAILELRFMPVVAELRALAGQGQTMALDAEMEWQHCLGHVERYGGAVYAEVRAEDGRLIAPGDPPLELSPAGQLAFRSIGGRQALLYALESGRPRDLHFARKNFLEAYGTATEHPELLDTGPARKLLERAAGHALPKPEPGFDSLADIVEDPA